MELMEAIRGRRAVRSYTEESIPLETLKRLVDAAIQAPSAVNAAARATQALAMARSSAALTAARPALVVVVAISLKYVDFAASIAWLNVLLIAWTALR